MSLYISDDSYTAMLKPGTELTKLTWAISRDRTGFHCHRQNSREWPVPHHVVQVRQQRQQNAFHIPSRSWQSKIDMWLVNGQLVFMKLFFSNTLIFMFVDSIGEFKLRNSCVEPSTHLNSQENPLRGNIYLYWFMLPQGESVFYFLLLLAMGTYK